MGELADWGEFFRIKAERRTGEDPGAREVTDRSLSKMKPERIAQAFGARLVRLDG